MVTPYKNESAGSKDACNFYHSQVRIIVEYSFSMLVHRWAIMRGPMPVNITLHKVTVLAHCLCKLHNYFMNENEIKYYEQTKMYTFYYPTNGSTSMEEDSNGNYMPNEILNGGDY